MADNRYYATGKRKTAIARVWLKPGTGTIQVNDKAADEYFGGLQARSRADHPFALTATTGKYDVVATLRGGGKCAQADALRHGISKALLEIDPEMRSALKKAGLLTRDSRVKERKKYGRKAARASFQFSKR
ncbi:MAG: 30S ribosomal protein S9 [Desulfobulbaceae bacterium]|nr:30S ribosomal protein S9 [Desulfobulbaceae bacterium]